MRASLQAEAVTQARDFDGFGTNYPGSPEPIYGNVYLPRKFKIAVTVPGDNSVDVLTNDVGVVVITDDAGELLVSCTPGMGLAVGLRLKSLYEDMTSEFLSLVFAADI